MNPADPAKKMKMTIVPRGAGGAPSTMIIFEANPENKISRGIKFLPPREFQMNPEAWKNITALMIRYDAL